MMMGSDIESHLCSKAENLDFRFPSTLHVEGDITKTLNYGFAFQPLRQRSRRHFSSHIRPTVNPIRQLSMERAHTEKESAVDAVEARKK